MKALSRAPLPQLVAVEDGLELAVRVNRRARRISLKVDAALDRPILVLPNAQALAEGVRFAESRATWLKGALAKVPPRVPFADGVVVPYLGEPHRIRHRSDRFGGVWCEGKEIQVAGRREHVARRVGDWLKSEARRLISAAAIATAERIERRPARVSVRDPKSRWGSCAADGRLSFSWRLVLAPPAVMDYVVAHEVAHLLEAHHGPAFWALVERLEPEFATAKRWLKQHGASLHRYG